MSSKKLDSYLSSYGAFNDWLIKKRYQYLSKYFIGKTCLELGIAEGTGTKYLLDRFESVTVVDGSRRAINNVRKRYPVGNLTGVVAYFEDMYLGNYQFDTILLAHVLEHVDDPIVVLRQAKSYLKRNGVIIIDVPNACSLHRQIGVEMGVIKKITDLSEADLSIGHKRVYTPQTFKKDIKEAGLKINHFGGMFIKLLSNEQTEKIFNQRQLEVFFNIGEKNPEIAAEIYVVCMHA